MLRKKVACERDKVKETEMNICSALCCIMNSQELLLSILKIIQIFKLHKRDHCDAFSRNEKSRLTFPFFFPLDPVDFFCFCFYHFHFLIFLKSLTLPVKIMAIADRHMKVSAFSQPLTLWFEKFLASLPHSLEKKTFSVM